MVTHDQYPEISNEWQVKFSCYHINTFSDSGIIVTENKTKGEATEMYEISIAGYRICSRSDGICNRMVQMN